jgi:ectoine hydroxylase-related dioxygenase (phytanoyl-CoA dioxygenase family)
MTASNATTTELQELYERDGFYIHPHSVLAPEILEGAAHGLDAVRAGTYDTGEAPDHRMWNPGDNPLSICKIEQPQLANFALREAIKSPLLGQLAGAITGARQVQVWWVQLLHKPGIADVQSDKVFAKVGWHQDQSYWSEWEEGSELFTAWLALSDVTPDAGPMVFVAGSHRWGLLEGGNFFAQDQDALRGGINLPAGETWREVVDILPPGGVSFHHRLTFHGSHNNVTNRPRCSLAIHMKTDKSATHPDSWVARYLNRPEICPVIFEA